MTEPAERSTPPERITMQAPAAAIPTNAQLSKSRANWDENRNEDRALTWEAISQATSIASRTSAVPNSRVRQKRKPVTGAHGAPAARTGQAKRRGRFSFNCK